MGGLLGPPGPRVAGCQPPPALLPPLAFRFAPLPLYPPLPARERRIAAATARRRRPRAGSRRPPSSSCFFRFATLCALSTPPCPRGRVVSLRPLHAAAALEPGRDAVHRGRPSSSLLQLCKRAAGGLRTSPLHAGVSLSDFGRATAGSSPLSTLARNSLAGPSGHSHSFCTSGPSISIK